MKEKDPIEDLLFRWAALEPERCLQISPEEDHPLFLVFRWNSFRKVNIIRGYDYDRIFGATIEAALARGFPFRIGFSPKDKPDGQPEDIHSFIVQAALELYLNSIEDTRSS